MKPKFKIGDKVKHKWDNKIYEVLDIVPCIVNGCCGKYHCLLNLDYGRDFVSEDMLEIY